MIATEPLAQLVYVRIAHEHGHERVEHSGDSAAVFLVEAPVDVAHRFAVAQTPKAFDLIAGHVTPPRYERLPRAA